MSASDVVAGALVTLGLLSVALSSVGLVAALAVPAAAQPTAPSMDLIARGKYVFGVAAGCGCHTAPDKAATKWTVGSYLAAGAGPRPAPAKNPHLRRGDPLRTIGPHVSIISPVYHWPPDAPLPADRRAARTRSPGGGRRGRPHRSAARFLA